MAFFPPGLVWLASYPKSGNTWMRVLLSNLLADAAEPASINNLSAETTLGSCWRFGDDMLVDADLFDGEELERMRALHCDSVAAGLTSPFFCKTHERFEGHAGTPVLGTGARAAVYIVRDPRDVAISLSHHASASLDEAIALMADEKRVIGGGLQVLQLLGDWPSHASGWTEQSRTPIKVVRYEDMHRDAFGTFQSVIAFLNGHATEAEIQRAVANSRLEELQRQETEKGFRERMQGQERFFRSGRTGEWKDVLTLGQIRTIEERFGPVMTCFGYQTNT
ncbi:aryl sulfotransferase [Constrictibacter sp. MBR-5]|uniref:sulfotransferase domain-containing protein n=1 Tax=Constrictibacter sp. MBR-5 TaxID=3156467 RepID=UPI00339B68B0